MRRADAAGASRCTTSATASVSDLTRDGSVQGAIGSIQTHRVSNKRIGRGTATASGSSEPDHAYRSPPERAHVEGEARLSRGTRCRIGSPSSSGYRRASDARLARDAGLRADVPGHVRSRAAHHVSPGRVSVVVDGPSGISMSVPLTGIDRANGPQGTTSDSSERRA